MGRYVPMIYVALDNKKAEYQSHMIEVEGMINNQTHSYIYHKTMKGVSNISIVIYCHSLSMILIDSGDSHSYIYPKMVEIFQLPRSKHEKSWLVQLATGVRRKVNEIVKSCLIDMNGLNTRADLNILPLGSYDCLIGMDWMDPHHALLDGHNKAFTCLDEEGNQRKVKGIPRQ
jgi:hypothetical protein